MVVLHLKQSDVNTNTEIALKNVVKDTAEEKKHTMSSVEEIASRTEELAIDGQKAIQSDLFQMLQSAVPAIDNVVQVLDNIAEVSVGKL